MGLKTFRLLVISAMATLSVAAGAMADEGEDDHERARELYEQGRIHSLVDVMNGVAGHLDGEVVGVELVQAGQRWVYRLQVIDRQGQRSFIDVDAGAGISSMSESDD